MRPIFKALALTLLAAPTMSQTTIVGDAWVLGSMSVGTTTVSARWTAVASSADVVAFQVSGVDLTPFLRVGLDGTVGLSTHSAARLDVWGFADNSDVGLLLRSGDIYGASQGRFQMAFGQNGALNYRHAIATVHSDSTTHNSIDFRVWTPDAGTTSVASMTALSLVTSTASFGASAHVRPFGEPDVELVVSNGSLMGGGTIHVSSQVTPSSRGIKEDIAYLGQDEGQAAYGRLKSLKPVRFRYMRWKRKGYARDGRAPLRRGLLYEEAPEVIRGPGESLSLDQRLLESELAFQELARRLERLESEGGR